METNKSYEHPVSDALPLTVDTSVGQHALEESPATPQNIFTTSPTTALDTYPPPLPMTENEKVQVDEGLHPAPVFSASAPKLSITRRNTTSYQKQTFRMDAGINPADVIVERLEAWRGVLKNLANFWKEISAAHSQTAKGYTKGSSLIEVPFQDTGLHFREDGGVQTVWAATREYSVIQAKHHHDYSMFLDRSIIQGLRSVKKDVKAMAQSIRSDDRLKTDRLYRCREQADILQTRLNKYIQLVNTTPEHASDKTDPYIVSACLEEQTAKLYREENRLHDSMLNLQREYAIFERKMIDNAKLVLHSLQEYRTEDKYLTDHTVHMIMDTFNNLDSDCETTVFFDRRQGELVPDNAAYKDLNNITYENRSHPLVIPCRVGFFERKTFVTKNWVEHKYALTPSGFLHEYKSEKDFPCNPEKSIFIPHTTVVGKESNVHHDYIFEIRGRNNSKGKIMKTLDRDKTYVLRTRTGDEMQAWMDILTPMSHQFRPAVPHEPEPHMQPINSTNIEVMSRSNTWATPSVASRASTWASEPGDYVHEDNLPITVQPNIDKATAGVSHMDMNAEQGNYEQMRTNIDNGAAEGFANMEAQSEQLDQMDASEKTQTDEHNPFVEHHPQQQSNKVTEVDSHNAENISQGFEKHNYAQAKIPVSLFDQTEDTSQTAIQHNQRMPGTLMP